MQRICYAAIAFLLCLLIGGRGALVSKVKESGIEQNHKDIIADSSSYGLFFDGDSYTEYYVRDMLLTHIWQPDGSPDIFETAYYGTGKDGDPQIPREIQTFTNDADHNFIMECESVFFNKRLYRKTSFELPDYLDDKTKISKIIIDVNNETDNTSKSVVLSGSMEKQSFMQTIRNAISISSQHPELMNTVDVEEEKYDCYIEFEGIRGRLYVGFVCKDGNGKWCFSAYETDYSTGLAGFKSIALPEVLQNRF